MNQQPQTLSSDEQHRLQSLLHSIANATATATATATAAGAGASSSTSPTTTAAPSASSAPASAAVSAVSGSCASASSSLSSSPSILLSSAAAAAVAALSGSSFLDAVDPVPGTNSALAVYHHATANTSAMVLMPSYSPRAHPLAHAHAQPQQPATVPVQHPQHHHSRISTKRSSTLAALDSLAPLSSSASSSPLLPLSSSNSRDSNSLRSSSTSSASPSTTNTTTASAAAALLLSTSAPAKLSPLLSMHTRQSPSFSSPPPPTSTAAAAASAATSAAAATTRTSKRARTASSSLASPSASASASSSSSSTSARRRRASALATITPITPTFSSSTNASRDPLDALLSPTSLSNPPESSATTQDTPGAVAIGRKQRKQSRPLLTDDVKKRNHIASEQKRRLNIRVGFDNLVSLVPGLADLPRSEPIILARAAEHLQVMLGEHQRVKGRARQIAAQLMAAGVDLPGDGQAGEDIRSMVEQVLGGPGDVAEVSEDEEVKREVGEVKIRTYRRTVYATGKRAAPAAAAVAPAAESTATSQGHDIEQVGPLDADGDVQMQDLPAHEDHAAANGIASQHSELSDPDEGDQEEDESDG